MPALLLLGLFAPLLAVTWYSFDLQRRTLASAFDYELATMADVLANGMREPIWNLIPKSGQPLLDAIAADSRVLAVRVSSRAQGEFLSYQGPSHANAEPQLFTRQVSRNGVVIGSLELVVDRSGIADRMADQRQSIYGAMAVQLLISLVIVLIAAHLYGASRREAELRRLNENLNREILERNEAERAMRQAKEEAQIANRAKSEFLAHVSHELRTPLNAILGFSETLNLQLMGPIENPQYRQYVQHIYDSGQHLLALISDVLDITRIEANETAIHEESCDLPEVSASCFAMIRGRAQDKGIDLSTRFEPGLPQLFADLRCLKQIMINLLGNAVKFTPPGGSVICRAELASDGGIVLSISDTGIGMRPDDVPRALEPFSQLTGSATKSSDGTGLGLALVNAMVAAHDGKLDIITAPGQGTTVQIKFPENRTVQPQARAAAQ